MLSETELNEAERKLYLSYHEDGVLDLIAGLPVLMFGLGMIFDATMLFILTFLPIVLYLPMKQMITLPRMGYVRFTPKRRRKNSIGMVALFIAGTLSLIMGIVAFLGFEGRGLNLRAFMLEYGQLVFGVVMAAPYALISFFFGFRKFAGYAVLVFAGWLSAFLFAIPEGIPVVLAGGLISLIGLVALVRFLADNSRPGQG